MQSLIHQHRIYAVSVTYPSMVWHFIIVKNKNLRGRERTRFKSMKHLVSLMNLNIVNVILSYIYIIQLKKEYDCICVVKLLHQIRFFLNSISLFSTHTNNHFVLWFSAFNDYFIPPSICI